MQFIRLLSSYFCNIFFKNLILLSTKEVIDVKNVFTFFILVTFFTFFNVFFYFFHVFYFQVTLSKKHAADGYLNFTG